MKRRYELTGGQLASLAFVGVLSASMRLLPWRLPALAGRGMLLSLALAAVPVGLLLAVTGWLLRQRGPGEGPAELLCRSLGPRAGTAVCVLWTLWLPVYGGYLLRSGAERLVAVVYDLGSPGLFGALMLAAAAPAAFARPRTLGRLGQAAGEILAVMTALTCLLLMPEAKGANLWPPERGSLAGVLRGAVPVYETGAVGVYVLLLAGFTPAERETGRRLARGVAAGLAAGGLVTALTVGALSPRLAAAAGSPFFVAVRDLSLFGFVERIESAAITLWVLSDILWLAVLLSGAGQLLSRLRPVRRPRRFAPLLLAGTGAAALLLAEDSFTLRSLARGAMSDLSLAMTGAPLLAAAGGLLWQKRPRKKSLRKTKKGA